VATTHAAAAAAESQLKLEPDDIATHDSSRRTVTTRETTHRHNVPFW